MKSVDEMYDVIERVRIILSHYCSKRCLKRINGTKGDGPGNFVKHKNHAVLDNPYSTSYQYIPVEVSLTPNCIESLKEYGLCTTEEDTIEFLDPYFTPKSHMVPCDWNTTDNMSPIIFELFLLVKSICNVQSVNHTNGIVTS